MAAVRALGHFLSTQAGRELVAQNDYAGEQIVPADADDEVGAVFDRVFDFTPPVLIAVHFPDRTGDAVFSFLMIRPERGDVETRAAGRTSTIGMMADSMSPGPSVDFAVTDAWRPGLVARPYLATAR